MDRASWIFVRIYGFTPKVFYAKNSRLINPTMLTTLEGHSSVGGNIPATVDIGAATRRALFSSGISSKIKTNKTMSNS